MLWMCGVWTQTGTGDGWSVVGLHPKGVTGLVRRYKEHWITAGGSEQPANARQQRANASQCKARPAQTPAKEGPARAQRARARASPESGKRRAQNVSK